MNRKLATYFLLSIMVFHTAGFYLVFEINRLLIKREMSLRISSGSSIRIEKIIINGQSSSLKIIGKSEIEYNGKMYDVLYQTSRGSSRVYFCVHDVREDSINVGISKRMKDQTRHLLIPIFGTIAVLSGQIAAPEEAGIEFSFLPFAFNVSSPNRRIPESPPKVC